MKTGKIYANGPSIPLRKNVIFYGKDVTIQPAGWPRLTSSFSALQERLSQFKESIFVGVSRIVHSITRHSLNKEYKKQQKINFLKHQAHERRKFYDEHFKQLDILRDKASMADKWSVNSSEFYVAMEKLDDERIAFKNAHLAERKQFKETLRVNIQQLKFNVIEFGK